MERQTAGRTRLGDLAPKFAELNDDVLFGEVWARTDKMGVRDRSLITVVALVAKGITDSSLEFHINNAKNHGITLTEMVEAITHIAFYVGWPNAWAVFPMVRAAYANETVEPADSLFGTGEFNEAYAQYFVGKSYLKVLNTAGVAMSNVTFEPGCRNNWHVHHKSGQILLCTDGEGWYQEWGQPARKLMPGDVATISPEVKHWHGATRDSWFTHVALAVPADGASNEWLEPVEKEDYDNM